MVKEEERLLDSYLHVLGGLSGRMGNNNVGADGDIGRAGDFVSKKAVLFRTRPCYDT
uniref:Uncharacterized protein n=1 Tax=viral metagenome TaxID=1070528 RepID=A0A6H2A4Q5_9ZZZZ